MQKRDFKKPMFTLDRSRRGDLSRQVSAGLRTAIETGYYQPGEILPPVRDLAEILEISKGIAEQAVARLREEGLISPRPSVGSVVCASDRPLWKGQVLIVVPPDGGNTADNTMSAVLRN
ncbi:MAG: winged helix-turn-helix transcriptional regulator, partial [Lentisphaerae bacterium]|nr:winged helix-turn-helix transcriptional regulator [Lentisphaerota bacterium]